MDAINLTDAEKRAVALYLYKSKRLDVFLNSAIYIGPSIVFAGYGFVKNDFLALLVAYVAMLLVVLYWLVTASKDAIGLNGALAKYEAFVAAHKPPAS